MHIVMLTALMLQVNNVLKAVSCLNEAVPENLGSHFETDLPVCLYNS